MRINILRENIASKGLCPPQLYVHGNRITVFIESDV